MGASGVRNKSQVSRALDRMQERTSGLRGQPASGFSDWFSGSNTADPPIEPDHGSSCIRTSREGQVAPLLRPRFLANHVSSVCHEECGRSMLRDTPSRAKSC